ncbi:MAG: hypothetical protein QGH47_03480 [Candidatus Woesearchaeota archaeon]|jgi:phosphate uptake regulator|nr:hypothetical protein [Candidatus Woesearchaeota archaeon]
MKRKVVKHGPATYIISLPSKWIKRFDIRKGDQLEVNEDGKMLTISTEKSKKEGKIEVDISGLDRTSIVYLIRALYKLGYDEINLLFKNQSTPHYRLDINRTVISIIHEEVDRLPGMEVIQQRANRCVIKTLSEMSFSEFDASLRRIFLLLIDALNDLTNGIMNKDKELLATIEQKNNTINKFLSFCQRILNRHGLPDFSRTANMLRIISTLKKILDVIRISSRLAIALDCKPSQETNKLLSNTHQSILYFYQLFYKYSNVKVQRISEIRDNISKKILNSYKKLSKEELVLVMKISQIITLIGAAMEARMGLEY